MRQKVALTAAHLLCVGKVADMGMGSGRGACARCALSDDARVESISIRRWSNSLARSSLFRILSSCRDIADRVLPDNAIDGIFDSSVLHHVTSFGGYRYDNAARALENQIGALRTTVR